METKEICQQWLNDAQLALIAEYDSEGRRASGGFEKSLSNEVIETTDGLSLVQYGADYTYWMIKGRSKNKKQDDKSIAKFVRWAGNTFIKDWVKQKNIKISPFAIANKIAKKGYAGKPLIENVFTETRIDSLLNQINTNFVANSKIEITQMLKK